MTIQHFNNDTAGAPELGYTRESFHAWIDWIADKLNWTISTLTHHHHPIKQVVTESGRVIRFKHIEGMINDDRYNHNGTLLVEAAAYISTFDNLEGSVGHISNHVSMVSSTNYNDSNWIYGCDKGSYRTDKPIWRVVSNGNSTYFGFRIGGVWNWHFFGDIASFNPNDTHPFGITLRHGRLSTYSSYVTDPSDRNGLLFDMMNWKEVRGQGVAVYKYGMWHVGDDTGNLSPHNGMYVIRSDMFDPWTHLERDSEGNPIINTTEVLLMTSGLRGKLPGALYTPNKRMHIEGEVVEIDGVNYLSVYNFKYDCFYIKLDGVWN